MIAAMCLEGSLLNLVNTLNGPCGLNKLVLTDRTDTAADINSRLNLNDIEHLKKKLAGRKVSYLVQQEDKVKGNQHTATVKILATNCQWVNFCTMDFRKGSMWTPETELEGQRVAVIGTNLANSLYGSEDVVGMPIYIKDKPFLINGVIADRTGIFSDLTGDGLPEIYVPGAAFYDLSNDLQIREIDIETRSSSAGDAGSEIANLFKDIGKPAAFKDFNYHEAGILMEQVPKLQCFLIGLFVILTLLQIFKSRTKTLLAQLRLVSRELAFGQVLMARRRQIYLHLGFTAILLLIIILIWNRIHFSPYIPSRYIPDNLIDISYFMEVISQDISNGQQVLAYYQPRPEIQLALIRNLNRILYYIIWPIGLAMVLYAWPQIKKESSEGE